MKVRNVSELIYKGCQRVLFRCVSFLLVRQSEGYIPVQEYRGIGIDEFNELYEFLLEAKLKYVQTFESMISQQPNGYFRFDFDADLKSLTISMPTPSHDASASHCHNSFANVMKHQRRLLKELGNNKRPHYMLGTGLESIHEGDSPRRKWSNSKYMM